MIRKVPRASFNCLSTDIDSINAQITLALNSFDLFFDQLKCSFNDMKRQFDTLNTNLEYNNLSPCFQPTIKLLRQITESIPNSLFFQQYSITRTNFEKTKSNYETIFITMKDRANFLSDNLQQTVLTLQKAIEQLKKYQDSIILKSGVNNQNISHNLIQFYSDFKNYSNDANNLILDYYDVSLATINKINLNVKEILIPLMNKCSLKFPDELVPVPSMLTNLIQEMKKELNVSYVIQDKMIPILSPVLKTQIDQQSTHCVINYFELENKLANTGRAKLVIDYDFQNIHIKAGKMIEVLNSGYSRYWKVKTITKSVLYVPSEILQIL